MHYFSRSEKVYMPKKAYPQNLTVWVIKVPPDSRFVLSCFCQDSDSIFILN